MTEHIKADWSMNEHNLPDGSYIDSDNDVCYVKNGKIHREDGPAKEWPSGHKEWYINGKRHREDGPAIEWVNGGKDWYKNGKRHREDGSAMEYADGRKEWWVDNKQYKTEGAYLEALKIWKMNEAMK